MAFFIINDEGCKGAVRAQDVLRHGGTALDAVEQALIAAEDDLEARTVGANAYPNLLGRVELDAGIMDGRTLRTGAVGALTDIRHPIAVARKILEELPHEILVGDGARRFAVECGQPLDNLLTEPSRAEWQAWFEETVPQAAKGPEPTVALAPYIPTVFPTFPRRDTAIVLAGDRRHDLATGASTSGWPYKYPGRLGDAPLIGAGQYCHNRYGAVACTHTGEMTIRLNTAFSVLAMARAGMDLLAACHRAIDDLVQLTSGTRGPVCIYAVDALGNSHALGLDAEPDYYYWCDGMETAERRKVTRIDR